MITDALSELTPEELEDFRDAGAGRGQKALRRSVVPYLLSRELRCTACDSYWTAVSPSTQSTVAALSSTIVDPNELLAQPSWWRTLTGKPRGFTQLTGEQREELRRAYSSLHWPLCEEGPEIRLVAVAENVVARTISDPSWAHPMLDGHRSFSP